MMIDMILDWLPLLALLGFVWTPKTWTPGELVSAAAMNTNIRDHLNESLRTQTTVLTGTQNNLALEGVFAYLQCNNAAGLTLTGALVDSGNVNGSKIIVEAINSAVTFKHQDAGSTTSNRFITPDAGDLALAVNERALLIYDGTNERWRVNRADSYQLTEALADIVTAEGNITTLQTEVQALEDDLYDYSARVFNNANESIANATWTDITFNTETWDPDNMHSVASNTERIVVPNEGRYLVGCGIQFAANAVGYRDVRIIRNSVNEAEFLVAAVNGAATIISFSTLSKASASDYYRVRVYQNSGGALNVITAANVSPILWVQKVDGPHAY